jgi:DNA-binding FadR family transcriptional regulator
MHSSAITHVPMAKCSPLTLREIGDLETAWKGMAATGANVELFVRSDTAFHQVLYGACHNPICVELHARSDGKLG